MNTQILRRMAVNVSKGFMDNMVSLLYFVGTKSTYEPFKPSEPCVIVPEIVTTISLSGKHHAALDSAIERSRNLLAEVTAMSLDNATATAALIRHREFLLAAAVAMPMIGDKKAEYSWELAFTGRDISEAHSVELRRYVRGFIHHLNTVGVYKNI